MLALKNFSVIVQFMTPLRLALVGSIMLSAVAIAGNAIVSRDATLYFDTANAFLGYGLKGAFLIFDWPWFSILLALTHKLTGLSVEASAYIWCSLFMAGVCGILVESVQRWLPGSGYISCLVVLATPLFNEYRDETVREFGFWFFIILALRLVEAWRQSAGFIAAAQIQIAIILAACFRLEAVFLMLALNGWVFWQATASRWQRLLELNALLFPVSVVVCVFLWLGDMQFMRLENYLRFFHSDILFSSFNLVADALRESMPYKYSREDAGKILLIGMFGLLLIDFLNGFGPFALPLFVARNAAWRILAGPASHYTCAWLVYFLVLSLFFVRNQFMISRYEGLLCILAVPAAVASLQTFIQRFPRMGKALCAVAILVMFANVVSLSAPKSQLIDAGYWLRDHVAPDTPVFYDDVRISYYAGRGARRQPLSRDQAMSDKHLSEYRYFFIEAKDSEQWLHAWLEHNAMRILASFSNDQGDTIVVLGR